MKTDKAVFEGNDDLSRDRRQLHYSSCSTAISSSLGRDESQHCRHVHVSISSQAEGHLAGLVAYDGSYPGGVHCECQLIAMIRQFTLALP